MNFAQVAFAVCGSLDGRNTVIMQQCCATSASATPRIRIRRTSRQMCAIGSRCNRNCCEVTSSYATTPLLFEQRNSRLNNAPTELKKGDYVAVCIYQFPLSCLTRTSMRCPTKRTTDLTTGIYCLLPLSSNRGRCRQALQAQRDFSESLTCSRSLLTTGMSQFTRTGAMDSEIFTPHLSSSDVFHPFYNVLRTHVVLSCH